MDDTKAPTVEAVKELAQRVYQRHAFTQECRDDMGKLDAWMNARYDEYNRALTRKWEPVERVYTETDNGMKALDIVVKFFNIPDFIFEIDLNWGE